MRKKYNFIRDITDYNLVTDSMGDNIDLEINSRMRNKSNRLVIYDKNGNILSEHTNKVVARGRIEQIETLFRKYDISEKNNIQYDKPDNKTSNRWISTFGVGSGGAPLSEGFNPYTVDPTNTELNSPLMFIKDSIGAVTSGYWDNMKKKDFKSIYLNWDKGTDDVYALLVCEVGYDDCRGDIINEIGLYYCNHTLETNGTIIGKSNFDLYAKANMNSINKSQYDNSSSFIIAYKVFI